MAARGACCVVLLNAAREKDLAVAGEARKQRNVFILKGKAIDRAGK